MQISNFAEALHLTGKSPDILSVTMEGQSWTFESKHHREYFGYRILWLCELAVAVADKCMVHSYGDLMLWNLRHHAVWPLTCELVGTACVFRMNSRSKRVPPPWNISRVHYWCHRGMQLNWQVWFCCMRRLVLSIVDCVYFGSRIDSVLDHTSIVWCLFFGFSPHIIFVDARMNCVSYWICMMNVSWSDGRMEWASYVIWVWSWYDLCLGVSLKCMRFYIEVKSEVLTLHGDPWQLLQWCRVIVWQFNVFSVTLCKLLLIFCAVRQVLITIERHKAMCVSNVWSYRQKGNAIVTIWTEFCLCFWAE
jgi:hypothetical protein